VVIVLSAFDINDLVRIGNHTGTNGNGDSRAAFKDPLGVATDPSAVTVRLRKPSGAVLIYGWPTVAADGILVKEATGKFYIDVLIDEAGTWYWQLTGTGTVQTSEAGEFWVRPTLVG
jgi:hypothetical protein